MQLLALKKRELTAAQGDNLAVFDKLYVPVVFKSSQDDNNLTQDHYKNRI